MYNDVCTKGIAPGTKGACGKDCSILHAEIRISVKRFIFKEGKTNLDNI